MTREAGNVSEYSVAPLPFLPTTQQGASQSLLALSVLRCWSPSITLHSGTYAENFNALRALNHFQKWIRHLDCQLHAYNGSIMVLCFMSRLKTSLIVGSDGRWLLTSFYRQETGTQSFSFLASLFACTVIAFVRAFLTHRSLHLQKGSLLQSEHQVGDSVPWERKDLVRPCGWYGWT